jgi:hypothetical protein
MGKLADVWEAAGNQIIVLRGIDCYEPADILVIHADVTHLPEGYVEFSRRYPVVINGRVLDISKRRISRHLVSKDDSYGGPVIVKTDCNFGGLPERSRNHHLPLQILFSKLQLSLPVDWQLWFSRMQISFFPSWIRSLTPYSYPIYANPGHVPIAVWQSPHLVVEKYRPEREGDHYCLRQWIFLGDKEINQRCFSLNPIVKARNVVHREDGLPVPKGLRALRTELGFDYGKFDYGLVNGELILYDANWTPTMNFRKDTSRKLRVANELAQGLQVFLQTNQ